jgi:hypothetical protein
MLARAQTADRCAWRSSVDRHFQRRIRPAEESGLRAHLASCPRCRQRYDRHLLLGQLLPMRRPDAADRLATGLGLAAVGSISGAGWPLSDWRWVVAGMALGLGVVTLVLSPADRARGGGEPDRTRAAAAGPARGTPAAALEIFRHTTDGLSGPTRDVAADDRLVFAVRNDRWRFLTISALDATGAAHLLLPTRAIARTAGLQLLPERALPATAVGPLRLVAVLTDGPLPDRELVSAVRGILSAGTGLRIEVPLAVRPAGRMR